jgi:hypothetical protein
MRAARNASVRVDGLMAVVMVAMARAGYRRRRKGHSNSDPKHPVPHAAVLPQTMRPNQKYRVSRTSDAKFEKLKPRRSGSLDEAVTERAGQAHRQDVRVDR